MPAVGLHETREDEGIRLEVKYGGITQTSKIAKADFLPTDVNNPKGGTVTKYIKTYEGGVTAKRITKIVWFDRENQGVRYRGWVLYLDLGKDGLATLTLAFDSSACSRFMKCARNIDFNQPITFRAWPDEDGRKTAFAIAQNDANVPQYYSREDSKDLPQPVKDEFSGKLNFNAQDEFLYNMMLDEVVSRCEEATTAALREEAFADDDVPF